MGFSPRGLPPVRQGRSGGAALLYPQRAAGLLFSRQHTTTESAVSTPAKVTLQKQENLSGDPAVATQGFGRVSREPAPLFDPVREIDAACAFFDANGYVVLSGCLDAGELAHLNEFLDRTQ